MKEDKAGELPPFDDPAHSSRPADSPVQQDASAPQAPPKDTEYAGHPEFSQDAAANKPPNGIGNSEPAQETEDHARHSEGVNPKYPSPQQNAGARHSRDS